MDRIQAFGFRDAAAETVFEDGLRLRVIPTDLEDPIQIEACVLSGKEELTCVATDGGYWSTGLTQGQFAERLQAAVQAERQVYRAYRAGRIEESDWQSRFRLFWKVMIRCRAIHGSDLPP